tara:strand:+ start:237 stop:410 length:174 start_codon:yes stop_codon:yes gene_type:complete
VTEQEARDLITSVIGLVDRPWDTRAAYALRCVREQPMQGDPAVQLVELAVRTLGYPT